MNEEHQFFARVTRALADAGIPFLVVGSHASSLYGIPRATNDIDVVIDPGREQFEQFIVTLGLGVYLSPDAAREAFRSRSLFNVVDFASGVKMDLIVRRDDPFAAEQFRRGRPGRLLGAEYPVASAEDVILAKLEWDRITPSERQLRDVLEVLQVQHGQLDLAYLRHWAAELGLTDRLGEMLRLASESVGSEQ